MVAFSRVELAGSDDFGQLLHVGRFDVHYIKRLICYFHMPQINPEIKAAKSTIKNYIRGGGSTGAAGAFALVNFQQWVHCTRPDEELSYKWPYFSLKMSFFSQKNELLV